MTFQEIMDRRLSLANAAESKVNTTQDAPEWQRVYLQQKIQPVEGVVFQRCGGGRRVIRKRIGSN